MTDADYEGRLREFIGSAGIACEHLVFRRSCHSVAEAAEAAGVRPEDLIKSICMIASDGTLVVAVVKGEDQASTSRVGKHLGQERPRTATPEEMLELTGYPCGGTPPFGFPARYLVDPRVLETGTVLGGGGSPRSLVRLASAELVRANGGTVTRVRR
ncbi:MAG: YbaK/EbsC family protein [Candidatus Eremiobacterota bacterium]